MNILCSLLIALLTLLVHCMPPPMGHELCHLVDHVLASSGHEAPTRNLCQECHV